VFPVEAGDICSIINFQTESEDLPASYSKGTRGPSSRLRGSGFKADHLPFQCDRGYFMAYV